jgi:hypothetical protein
MRALRRGGKKQKSEPETTTVRALPVTVLDIQVAV